VLTITERNIETLKKKVHAVQGWGILMKELKKLMESEEYQGFIQDAGVKKFKAMRSKRG